MKKNLLFTIIGLIAGTTLTATAAYVYTARDIGYQPSDETWNVTNANDALTSLKDDLNTITNKVEGIERIYKAGEVELVALVSDDSFYKDSNGKFVLSNSDTGRALLADTSTYKSLLNNEDLSGIIDSDTVTSFNSGNMSILAEVSMNGDTEKEIITTQKSYKKLMFIGAVIRTRSGESNLYINLTPGGTTLYSRRFSDSSSCNGNIEVIEFNDVPTGTTITVSDMYKGYGYIIGIE